MKQKGGTQPEATEFSSSRKQRLQKLESRERGKGYITIMKITLAALILGLSLIFDAGCMTTTGNCINAAYGGNVDNHKAGDDHPTSSNSGCQVITHIYYIIIGRPTAGATLTNAMGEEVGSAQLAEGKDGVVVAAEIHGLAPGKYAIHVHAVGKCDPPDFLSAGPYFNRTGDKEDRHVVDLPNFEVSANGKGDAGTTVKGATLDDGPNGLLGPNGTAIVIQEKADGTRSPRTGNASRRVACGVVKRAG